MHLDISIGFSFQIGKVAMSKLFETTYDVSHSVLKFLDIYFAVFGDHLSLVDGICASIYAD